MDKEIDWVRCEYISQPYVKDLLFSLSLKGITVLLKTLGDQSYVLRCTGKVINNLYQFERYIIYDYDKNDADIVLDLLY
jgi:hypothetical protein